jgi:peptide/nickel transport system ATP-binding protein
MRQRAAIALALALDPKLVIADEPVTALDVIVQRQVLDVIRDLQRRLRAYPHELSGGMRQRVTIGIALSLSPELIILDEPTTALDVVVQREILQQIDALKREFGFAVLFITHDLSLLLEVADRIAIMYAGEIVETAPADRLAASPLHPYTRGLLESFPPLSGPLLPLTGIPGTPPDLRDPPPGCRFHPRCPLCVPGEEAMYLRQTTERPRLHTVEPGHEVACHVVEESAR